MLTLKYITENTEDVIKRLAKKHFDGAEIIARVVELDRTRKATQAQVDAKSAEMNTLSKQIGMLFQQGKQAEAGEAKAKTTVLKDEIKSLNDRLGEAEKTLQELLVLIPNLPHESVPEGLHAEDNVVEKMGGHMPDLPADALPHWELAKKYDLIDFELGVKITGAGFPVYKGKGARLQRALIAFFLDNAREAGYLEAFLLHYDICLLGHGNGWAKHWLRRCFILECFGTLHPCFELFQIRNQSAPVHLGEKPDEAFNVRYDGILAGKLCADMRPVVPDANHIADALPLTGRKIGIATHRVPRLVGNTKKRRKV